MNSLQYPASALAGSAPLPAGSNNTAGTSTASAMAGSNMAAMAGVNSTVSGVLSALAGGPSLVPGQQPVASTMADGAVFIDDTADYQQETMPSRDTHPIPVDTELMHFLATPVKVHYEQWDIAGSVAAFDPWSLWFANAAVKRRLANYSLLSGKLVVRVVTNGNAYQYGRLIYGYLPAPSTDYARSQLTGLAGFAIDRLPFQFSIDPSKDSVVELELPYTARGEVVMANGMDVNIGAFQPLVVAPLATTSTGLLNPYTDITIFASLIDVKLQGRTTFFPTSGEWKGVLSKPLATMANVSSKFRNLPIIGAHADMFSNATSGLAGLTSAFGFSKAADVSNDVHTIPRSMGTMSATDDVDTSQLLSTDPRNTTNVDPRIIGLKSHDELALAYWFTRESLVGTYSWTDVQAVDSTVFDLTASPFYTTQSYPLAHSYLAHAMLPFRYWRGSLRFKFVIICNAFHTGRLQLTYEPNTTIVADPTNTNLTVIVDLAHVTEVILDVPFIPPDGFPWRDQVSTATNLATLISGNKLGNIKATVLSQLRAGGVSTSVRILTYISGGDDFEVAVPSFYRFRDASSYLSFFPSGAITTPPAYTALGFGPIDLSPTSAVLTTPDVPDEIGTTRPVYTEYSKDHFSDRVLSFRNLIKRYTIHEYIAAPGELASTASFSFLIPTTPRPSGFVVGAAGVREDHSSTSWCFMSYLLPSFLAMKGGMRYKLIPINPGDADVHIASKTNHGYSAYQWNNSAGPLQAWTYPTPSGSIATLGRVNPTLEVALPWESRILYAYTQDQMLNTSGRPSSIQVTKVSGTTTYYALASAAADDFTYWLCTGPPVLHVVAIA